MMSRKIPKRRREDAELPAYPERSMSCQDGASSIECASTVANSTSCPGSNTSSLSGSKTSNSDDTSNCTTLATNTISTSPNLIATTLVPERRTKHSTPSSRRNKQHTAVRCSSGNGVGKASSPIRSASSTMFNPIRKAMNFRASPHEKFILGLIGRHVPTVFENLRDISDSAADEMEIVKEEKLPIVNANVPVHSAPLRIEEMSRSRYEMEMERKSSDELIDCMNRFLCEHDIEDHVTSIVKEKSEKHVQMIQKSKRRRRRTVNHMSMMVPGGGAPPISSYHYFTYLDHLKCMVPTNISRILLVSRSGLSHQSSVGMASSLQTDNTEAATLSPSDHIDSQILKLVEYHIRMEEQQNSNLQHHHLQKPPQQQTQPSVSPPVKKRISNKRSSTSSSSSSGTAPVTTRKSILKRRSYSMISTNYTAKFQPARVLKSSWPKMYDTPEVSHFSSLQQIGRYMYIPLKSYSKDLPNHAWLIPENSCTQKKWFNELQAGGYPLDLILDVYQCYMYWSEGKIVIDDRYYEHRTCSFVSRNKQFHHPASYQILALDSNPQLCLFTPLVCNTIRRRHVDTVRLLPVDVILETCTAFVLEYIRQFNSIPTFIMGPSDTLAHLAPHLSWNIRLYLDYFQLALDARQTEVPNQATALNFVHLAKAAHLLKPNELTFLDKWEQTIQKTRRTDTQPTQFPIGISISNSTLTDAAKQFKRIQLKIYQRRKALVEIATIFQISASTAIGSCRFVSRQGRVHLVASKDFSEGQTLMSWKRLRVVDLATAFIRREFVRNKLKLPWLALGVPADQFSGDSACALLAAENTWMGNDENSSKSQRIFVADLSYYPKLERLMLSPRELLFTIKQRRFLKRQKNSVAFRSVLLGKRRRYFQQYYFFGNVSGTLKYKWLRHMLLELPQKWNLWENRIDGQAEEHSTGNLRLSISDNTDGTILVKGTAIQNINKGDSIIPEAEKNSYFVSF